MMRISADYSVFLRYTIGASRSGHGGIGRHARFRSWWLYSLGGSSPSVRTMVSRFHNNGDRMRVLKNERLEKEVLLTISKSDLERDVLAELLSQSHHVKKPGFRSGKIPPTLLFQERGQQAIDAVVHRAVLHAADDIIDHKPLGAPLSYHIDETFSAHSLQDLRDLDVRVQAVFAPEISDVVWTDIHLDRYIPVPTDQEIDSSIAERAEKAMTSVPLKEKRAASIGDTLVYTMTYTQKNGAVKEVKGAFQLGSKTLPEEFESSLVGITEGHSVGEGLKVPKDFPDKSLAGKKVDFNIIFHEIRETVPHQVNEEFAHSQGFKTLDDFREKVRKSLIESGEMLSNILLRDHLQKKFGLLQSFDVPDSWVQSAVQALRREYEEKKKSDDSDETITIEGGEKSIQEEAVARERANCVVQKIIRDQNISVTDAELFGYAKAMAQSEGQPLDDVVSFLRRNKNVVDRISNEIQERKALGWISNQCTIEDKEVSFDAIKELFNQRGGSV